MGAGAEVDGELDLMVGVHVPAEAVQRVCPVGIHTEAGDADTLPTEACGLPCEAVRAPGDERMEADEDEQALRGEGRTSTTGWRGTWVARCGAAVSRT